MKEKQMKTKVDEAMEKFIKEGTWEGHKQSMQRTTFVVPGRITDTKSPAFKDFIKRLKRHLNDPNKWYPWNHDIEQAVEEVIEEIMEEEYILLEMGKEDLDNPPLHLVK